MKIKATILCVSCRKGAGLQCRRCRACARLVCAPCWARAELDAGLCVTCSAAYAEDMVKRHEDTEALRLDALERANWRT